VGYQGVVEEIRQFTKPRLLHLLTQSPQRRAFYISLPETVEGAACPECSRPSHTSCSKPHTITEVRYVEPRHTSNASQIPIQSAANHRYRGFRFQLCNGSESGHHLYRGDEVIYSSGFNRAIARVIGLAFQMLNRSESVTDCGHIKVTSFVRGQG